MTQSVNQVRNVAARSGFANPLTLGVRVADATEVQVFADGTQLTDSEYAIEGLGSEAGVEIEIIGAEDVDNYVGVLTFTALYVPLVDQNSDLSAGGAFGVAFENAIDDIIRRAQAIDDRVTRSLKVPVYIEGDQLLEPEPGKYLGWDEDGLIANLDGGGGGGGGGGGEGAVDSVNGETGTVVLTSDDIDDTGETNKWVTVTEKDKLSHITVSQNVDLDAIETAAAASKVKTDFITVTQAVDLDAIETNSNASKVKTDFITVTQAVDLDAIEAAALAAAPQSTTYTKNEVDALVTGLKWKPSVRVATTANGTLATAFENGDTVDGVVLATGDRILLKNQSDATENGIYVVAASGAPARASDADTGAEIKSSAVFVEEGTTNADTAWLLTNNGTITLGSTSLTYAQFAGAGVYTADGTSLQITGNVFAVKDAGVTMAKLADLTALSVIGRATNSSGVPAAIAAANDGEVMRRNGTTLGFGTIATAGIADAAVTLAKMANMATASLLGRNTAGTGVPEVLSAATVRALLDLEAGTDFNAYDGDLAALAALSGTNTIYYRSAANTWSAVTIGDNMLFSGGVLKAIEQHGVACSDETTSLTTGTGKASFALPYAFTVTGVYASVNTGSSSGAITVDINEAGTTILSTKITIDQSEFTGGSAGFQGTAAAAAVISDATIAANAQITVDIDGAGTGAKGLKVWIVGYPT